MFGEVERKVEEPKERNVRILKVSDNHLENSNSDVRTFGLYALRNCTFSLDLTNGQGFSAENIKETRCKHIKCSCENTHAKIL